MRKVSTLVFAFTLVVGMLGAARPAAAALVISGTVVDSVTSAPIQGVCVYLGVPGAFCWDTTDAAGKFSIDLDAISASPGGTWQLYFTKTGYEMAASQKFVVNGPYSFVQPMVKSAAPAGPCGTERAGTPTQTLYLPNITRNLGGAGGWYTPFIVQNVGTAATDLEVSFYKFSDGSCVARLTVAALAAGRSYSNDPRDNTKNPSLPDDAQFSVVVRSFGASIVGVVNEHQGGGAKAEAMSYVGFTAGATTVYLPNITRKFFGFNTPFIIQNLGTAATTATATFRPFDGSSGPITISRTIDPGRAKPIDPSSNDLMLGAPGLADGKQYSVTVTAGQPIGVVVNTQNDAPGVASPKALASDGISSGAATVYGAWAAKNAAGWRTPIIVQNLGTTAVAPVITFTPLAGSSGTANTYTFASIAPGSSKAFDPRFSFDTQGTTNVTCSGTSATCLGDGDYVFKVSGPSGSSLAVQVNPESATGATGYVGTPTPGSKYFLPNVTKSLCFCPSPAPGVGWTTPILLQSVTATSATLSWYRVSDGTLAATTTATLTAGGGVRIDPWSIGTLPADTQYSVVIDAGSGTINAIVTEFAPDGDNAMDYEGFRAP